MSQRNRLCMHQRQKFFSRSEQIPPPSPFLQAVSEGVERPWKFPGCPHGNSSFQDSSPDLLGSNAGSINQLLKWAKRLVFWSRSLLEPGKCLSSSDLKCCCGLAVTLKDSEAIQWYFPAPKGLLRIKEKNFPKAKGLISTIPQKN